MSKNVRFQFNTYNDGGAEQWLEITRLARAGDELPIAATYSQNIYSTLWQAVTLADNELYEARYWRVMAGGATSQKDTLIFHTRDDMQFPVNSLLGTFLMLGYEEESSSSSASSSSSSTSSVSSASSASSSSSSGTSSASSHSSSSWSSHSSSSSSSSPSSPSSRSTSSSSSSSSSHSSSSWSS